MVNDPPATKQPSPVFFLLTSLTPPTQRRQAQLGLPVRVQQQRHNCSHPGQEPSLTPHTESRPVTGKCPHLIGNVHH